MRSSTRGALLAALALALVPPIAAQDGERPLPAEEAVKILETWSRKIDAARTEAGLEGGPLAAVADSAYKLFHLHYVAGDDHAFRTADERKIFEEMFPPDSPPAGEASTTFSQQLADSRIRTEIGERTVRDKVLDGIPGGSWRPSTAGPGARVDSARPGRPSRGSMTRSPPGRPGSPPGDGC